MDDILVRIARTVACLPRLRMLSVLVRLRETTPTALAEELGIPLDMISTHLARLSAAGLIQRRRSGLYSYCVGRSPYSRDALSGRIMSWLCDTLRTPAEARTNCIPGQVCNAGEGEPESQVHEAVFEAATAFTHHRRLQILRRLSHGDVAAVQTLTRELHMSEAALSRHTAKLVRRGYVEATRSGRCLGYRLATKFKTPVHARLLKIVLREWQKA